jgi:Tfp pilus assembly protein PilX
MSKANRTDASGSIMVAIIGFIVAMGMITLAAVELIDSNMGIVGNSVKSQRALNIAEAGINYYLWHISHNSSDFKDGKSTPTTPNPTLGYGPYVHTYVNDNAVNEGTFTLWIKPQDNSSNIVNIRSIGQVTGSNITRTIDAKIGAPSFASYALVSDAAFWFGNTETASGPVHSNQGIRMDGASTSDVTSLNTTYIPPSSLGGDGSSHPGVWCSSSVTSPIDCDSRSKVDWRYPVPAVDFNLVAGSQCLIKKTAFLADSSTASLASLSNACAQTPTTRTAAYLPQRSSSGSFSITKGYLISLNPNGTYDLYNVNAENDTLTPYTSALTLQPVASSVALDSSGVIFTEDNVWVRSNPTFSGRVTIAAGRLANSNSANIVIADDLLYSTKNGQDAIGLVAEQDVLIAPYAPPSTGNFNFEVDAATIAQNGRVDYPSDYRYNSNCARGWSSPNQTFTYYGSVATRQTWTWTWLLGSHSCGDAAYSSNSHQYVSGVEYNNTQYDYNLLYTPPPSFPITSTYNVLSWREFLTKP